MKMFLAVMLIALLLMTLVSASAESPGTGSLPSLKAFYADYFDFGSSLSSSELKRTDRLPFYAAQYAIVTPENELKPENVFDEYNSQKAAKTDQGSVVLHFYTVKPLLDYAQANGLKVHGHVLFWHSQTPDVFFRESYSASKPYVSREIMLRRMENYVRIMMEYLDTNYPGLVVSWDVVNEAIDDSSGGYRVSNYTKIVGEDFVLQAFRFARKYAPEGTQLYYNDYSVPYQPKLDDILSLLDELIAEDLADGCGMQFHYQINTPTTTQIQLAIRKIIGKGLMIRVSEMDILADGNSDAEFAAQAKRYQDIMKILLKYADHIAAVQTWGTTDSLSWKSGSYPLLFNGDLSPKSAFYALVDPAILP